MIDPWKYILIGCNGKLHWICRSCWSKAQIIEPTRLMWGNGNPPVVRCCWCGEETQYLIPCGESNSQFSGRGPSEMYDPNGRPLNCPRRPRA